MQVVPEQHTDITIVSSSVAIQEVEGDFTIQTLIEDDNKQVSFRDNSVEQRES